MREVKDDPFPRLTGLMKKLTETGTLYDLSPEKIAWMLVCVARENRYDEALLPERVRDKDKGRRFLAAMKEFLDDVAFEEECLIDSPEY